MPEQQDVTFGFPDEWRDFLRRHPTILEIIYRRLASTLEKVLYRKAELSGQAQKLIYYLGGVCAEDFLEILLLSANGYGVGAQKLLRGLYERAVTVGYLVNHDSEAAAFVGYGAIHWGKHLHHAKKVFPISVMLPPELIAEIELNYAEAKPNSAASTHSRSSPSPTRRAPHT